MMGFIEKSLKFRNFFVCLFLYMFLWVYSMSSLALRLANECSGFTRNFFHSLSPICERCFSVFSLLQTSRILTFFFFRERHRSFKVANLSLFIFFKTFEKLCIHLQFVNGSRHQSVEDSQVNSTTSYSISNMAVLQFVITLALIGWTQGIVKLLHLSRIANLTSFF